MIQTDRQLVRRCLAGENRAFSILYDRHVGRVFGLLRRLTRNDAEAQDLAQETFLAAHSTLGAWRGEGQFGTWLCGIACRRYANACRRGAGRTTEPLDEALELPDPAGDPLRHLARHERRRGIERAIEALPDTCREAFVLVKVEGFSYREAAEWLDIPIGTVQSRLWRAVHLLQVALASQESEMMARPSARSAPCGIGHLDCVIGPSAPRADEPEGGGEDALQDRA